MSDLIRSQSERKHVRRSNLTRVVARTSSDHSFSKDLNSTWQKWRSWWSIETHSVPIVSSESSDSDVESVHDEDISIFMKARCRLMRAVGKLDDVFTGIKRVHTERYGPSEVDDTSRHIRLRMQDRAPGLSENQQWELILLINSVDLMQRKVQAVRSVSISYKARMGKQGHRRINEDNMCLMETKIEKTDSDHNLDVSTKTHVEETKAVMNPLVRGFAYILALLCSAFCFILGKNTQEATRKTSPDKAPSTSKDHEARLVEDAFNRKVDEIKGLEDSGTSNSWILLTVTSYPMNGIVQRCVNLETFLRMDRSATIKVKLITSATDETQDTTSTCTLQKRYLETIEYFGEIRACAYIVQMLRNIDAELSEALKGLDDIDDKPFDKRSRPYSDRGALLRQVLTRGEVELEQKQIANTSTCRQDFLNKDDLTKIVPRLEAMVEGIHMQYDSWRRAREMPVRRHKIGGKHPVKKAARIEAKMCFRQTSAGLVVRRICVTKKKSLVEMAFGGHAVVGLNVVPSMNT